MASNFTDLLKPKTALTAAAGLLALLNAAAIFMLLKAPDVSHAARKTAPPFALASNAPPNLQALNDKPLFDSARRAEVQKIVTAKAETPLKLTPKGTSISDDHRAVVMASDQGPVILREGESRYGVKIIKVSPEAVILETDGARKTVALAQF